jgi:osmotically-inducible protein OsmY
VNAFQRIATVEAEKIAVEVRGNRLILEGLVGSLVEKENAENAAWSAPGISVVKNYLQVLQEEDLRIA